MMEKKREWPKDFWQKLHASDPGVSEDFEIPEPLLDAPHRDAVIDEWIDASADDADDAERTRHDEADE